MLYFLLNGCILYTKVEPHEKDYLKKSSQDYYWINQIDGLTYSYSVDSIRDINIFGKLIIGKTDTLITRSFEKGNLYPTWYETDGLFFMRYTFLNNDTLMLNPRNDSLRFKLNKELPLIRTLKSSI